MITPTQMRAARAMLDVSQGYVAQHLGIAANTLSKIESGQSKISMSRLQEIQKFYERENIEFSENDGVSFKSSGVETYEGHDGFWSFMTNVYHEVQGGGDVFVSNVQEEYFEKWLGDNIPVHVERMAKIDNLNFKILVKEGDKNTAASDYASYKMLNSEQFGTLPLYLYGNKAALMVFTEDTVTIFVIQHKAVAEYFKARFMSLWDDAKELM